MKRCDIPKWAYQTINDQVGINTIYLGDFPSLNCKENKRLLNRLKRMSDALTFVRPTIERFPEAIDKRNSGYTIGVTYWGSKNVIELLIPHKVTEIIKNIYGLPMDDEGHLDASKFTLGDFLLLLSTLIREVQRWQDYLEEEV